MFQIGSVNGPDASPLYQWLTGSCPPVQAVFSPVNYYFWSPLSTNDVRWNYEKFLLNADGVVVSRWATATSPNAMIGDIKRLVSA